MARWILRLLLIKFAFIGVYGDPSTGFGQEDGFPVPYNSPNEADQAPLAADQAAATMQVPEGFAVNVFAAEPDVQNPIAIAWDGRGRMWVAENFTYAERQQRFDLSLRDRVLILEDTDHDGRADKRTVFTDRVQMLTSVEVGHGGVWLMCPPQLVFIPDANNDDVPDGPAQVVLDGFTVAEGNYHNFANGLRWGPDGWLYGRSGHSCPGKIGLPGTQESSRIPLEGGIWRYHPKHRKVEVLCHGTVNPWGHDWDENGELFFINTVIGHLWHMIPGAHFKESFGESLNRDVYQRMDMIADHYHFDTRENWTNSRDGRANDYGGGHAHVGMMLYHGSDLSEQYKGKLFTINMHGRRVNVERLERIGTGYVGRHEHDWLLASDPFFRGVEISQGPDGAVYIADWSDTGECHEHTGVHRTSGRIYRVSSNQSANANSSTPATTEISKPWCLAGPGELSQLWRAYQSEQVTPQALRRLLQHDDEHMRVWAIRLLTDFWPLDTILGPHIDAQYPEDPETYQALLRMAKEDSSGLVVLTLASTLQRLPLEHRAQLGSILAGNVAYADDPQLPLMVWYGLMPLADKRPADLLEIAKHSQWPRLSAWMTRAIALRADENRDLWDEIVEVTAGQAPEHRREVLTHLASATRGWQQMPAPRGWDRIRELAIEEGRPSKRTLEELEELFGQGRSVGQLCALVEDRKLSLEDRRSALEALVRVNSPQAVATYRAMITERGLGFAAAQGLAGIGGIENARIVIQNLRRLSSQEKSAVIESLVSRPETAMVLLEQLRDANGVLRREDILPFHARQILSLGDERLTGLLSSTWGSVRPSTAQQDRQKEVLRQRLTAEQLGTADLKRGRQLFLENCGQCHRLFGEGAQVGPDLTGAQRNSLDYLLENLIAPSAVVPSEYRMTIILTEDGRTLNGLVVKDDGKVLELQTLTNRLAIPKEDIQVQRLTELSSMPEGILDGLSDQERRDLVGYLMQTVGPRE